MASAICGAQDLGRACLISWKQQSGIFTGAFRDLFDMSRLPAGVFVNDGTYVQSDFNQQECLSPPQWFHIASVSKDPRIHINIKSHGKFYEGDQARWLAALRSLKPRPHLEAHVDKVLAAEGAGAPLVGIHIRRTDNQAAIDQSPTAAFVVLMDAYPPETRFVVATDDAAERQFLIGRYGEDRIISFAEVLNRTSSLGGIDAFLDFLALSKCQEILGSANSSFSEMAAAYGGRPLKVVRVGSGHQA